jgi:hypothetical protein
MGLQVPQNMGLQVPQNMGTAVWVNSAIVARGNIILLRDCKSRRALRNIHYLAPLMRNMKWIGLVAAVLLTVSCFTPWIFIESRNITISGVDTTGTNYGKPGYFHFVLVALFLLCTFMPRVWAKRLNLLVTALNLGWALRNFFIIATCSGGECPIRKIGLWLSLLASLLMLVSALFPDMKLPEKKTETR